MRCNGLPDPADPTDIRKYIHMWLLNIQREKTEELNWLLNTNESSILTQDQRVENMTKSHLKDLQHNIGDQFADRVREVLGVRPPECIEIWCIDSHRSLLRFYMRLRRPYLMSSTLRKPFDWT